MSNTKSTLKMPVIMIAAGLTLGLGGVWAAMNQDAFKAKPNSGLLLPEPVVRVASTVDPNSLSTLESLDMTFASIADQASRGVVSIKSAMGRNGGQGSGFIYRADGWIVTNDHVVGNAETVTVVLNDGREVEGKVRRADDDQVDLAMVKVDVTDLPVLRMADSDMVRPGQFALAVGSPFGLENSVTVGHISALGRGSEVYDQQFGPRGYTGMIQTDTTINPGNSGGPLLNIQGDVIGVNSTIYSTTMQSAGIGFAIPSKVVKVVADELIETGKFDRGLIGAMIDDLKPFQKKELDVTGGAIVLGTEPGTPAYDAGLRENDVITRIDGTPLNDQMDLRLALYERSPSDTVEVTYKRDGAIKSTKLTLSAPTRVANNAQPQQQVPQGFEDLFRQFGGPDMRERGQGGPQMDQSRPVQLGVTIREADPTVIEQFKLPEGTKGVVIMSIAPGSFAARSGLQPGDVIQSINGNPVTSAEGVGREVSKLRWGQRITIEYLRADGGSTVNGSVNMRLE